jgi:hypothetical protein
MTVLIALLLPTYRILSSSATVLSTLPFNAIALPAETLAHP